MLSHDVVVQHIVPHFVRQCMDVTVPTNVHAFSAATHPLASVVAAYLCPKRFAYPKPFDSFKARIAATFARLCLEHGYVVHSILRNDPVALVSMRIYDLYKYMERLLHCVLAYNYGPGTRAIATIKCVYMIDAYSDSLSECDFDPTFVCTAAKFGLEHMRSCNRAPSTLQAVTSHADIEMMCTSSIEYKRWHHALAAIFNVTPRQLDTWTQSAVVNEREQQIRHYTMALLFEPNDLWHHLFDICAAFERSKHEISALQEGAQAMPVRLTHFTVHDCTNDLMLHSTTSIELPFTLTAFALQTNRAYSAPAASIPQLHRALESLPAHLQTLQLHSHFKFDATALALIPQSVRILTCTINSDTNAITALTRLNAALHTLDVRFVRHLLTNEALAALPPALTSLRIANGHWACTQECAWPKHLTDLCTDVCMGDEERTLANMYLDLMPMYYKIDDVDKLTAVRNARFYLANMPSSSAHMTTLPMTLRRLEVSAATSLVQSEQKLMLMPFTTNLFFAGLTTLRLPNVFLAREVVRALPATLLELYILGSVSWTRMQFADLPPTLTHLEIVYSTCTDDIIPELPRALRKLVLAAHTNSFTGRHLERLPPGLQVLNLGSTSSLKFPRSLHHLPTTLKYVRFPHKWTFTRHEFPYFARLSQLYLLDVSVLTRSVAFAQLPASLAILNVHFESDVTAAIAQYLPRNLQSLLVAHYAHEFRAHLVQCPQYYAALPRAVQVQWEHGVPTALSFAQLQSLIAE